MSKSMRDMDKQYKQHFFSRELLGKSNHLIHLNVNGQLSENIF